MNGERLAALSLEQKLAFTETLLHKATRWIEILAARVTDIEDHPRYGEPIFLMDTLKGFQDLSKTALEDCRDITSGPKPGELWRERGGNRQYRIQYIGPQTISVVNEMELTNPTGAVVHLTTFSASDFTVLNERVQP